MIRNISLKNIFIINIITLILFFYSNSLYSNPAFPNFTDVVEKNIPSVVIVHAKKQMNTPSAGMPDMRNMPDEFKPFLDKFFNENQPNDNQQRQTPSFGSGFILSSDGYIMTNNCEKPDFICVRVVRSVPSMFVAAGLTRACPRP